MQPGTEVVTEDCGKEVIPRSLSDLQMVKKSIHLQ